MRAIDDKIIYKLNTSVPTVSFSEEVSAREKCKDLYEQVQLPHTYMYIAYMTKNKEGASQLALA